MINSEEKFFSYLKGRMYSDERKEFEDELNRSDNLNKEFVEYKRLNSILDETKNIQLSKDYSESVITDFRKRIESKKLNRPYFKYRYAFASILIIIAGYFLISLFDRENTQEIKFLLTEYSDTEIDLLSTNFDYSSNIEINIDDDAFNRIDSIYNENLSESLIGSINENSLEEIFSFNNVANVDEYLSDNDVDLIYDQLINKEIL